MPGLQKILLPLLFISLAVITASAQELTVTDPSNDQKLLQKIEVYHDRACDRTLEEVLKDWREHSLPFEKFRETFTILPGNPNCFWTSLTFSNPHPVAQTRILYFPKGWQDLSCYIPQENGTYIIKSVGLKNGREVLHLEIPPLDTMTLYVDYPEAARAYFPDFYVWEMSEQTHLDLSSRVRFKFLFIGAILFPLLLFLAQYIVERDKLNFYYLVFLLGAACHLLTILDVDPFFQLSPKLMPSMDIIARMFVISTCLVFAGLIKFIHVLLDVGSWSRPLYKAGNIMLGLFALLTLTAILYPPIFRPESYGIYLQYFRWGALLLFLYVLTVNIWSAIARIKFSRILLLAFSPFVLSGVLYALSYIVLRQNSQYSYESLTLITGFMLTVLLFGLILGVRNNVVKREKLQLEQRTETLRELDAFKSRFNTNITHEFRTPLTVIKGMSSQIKGQGKIKKLIQRNSERLLNLVNQLLDLSRLENNSLTINWVRGDVIPFLQYITESCHSLSDNKKINLAFFSVEEQIEMDFDENKLQQILLNLLSNAIKFTPEYGNVKVIVSRVSEGGQPLLQIQVKDTGRGIPRNKLAHIFDRFYQIDNSSVRHQEGSGIGLALVKELVQLLGGSIGVESEIDKGTAFKVLLPILQQADVKADSMPSLSSLSDLAEPEQTAGAMAKKGNSGSDLPVVLIIEDNVDVNEYIISCLDQDYALHSARDGAEGIKKAWKVIPDVILCDVMMPKMDGFEVCRRLKTDKRSSHIPIVLLTAKATQEDKIAGLSQGADAYLTKPFDKRELLLRLRNLSVQSQSLRERLSVADVKIDKPTEAEQREAAFLQEVNQVIESNLANELFNTNHLCKAIAMSRAQLYRKLKALTGRSTAEYIRSIRLQKAKHLLETTDLNIGDVALEVGYKDFSHFSRSFGKEFDLKPSDIRK